MTTIENTTQNDRKANSAMMAMILRKISSQVIQSPPIINNLRLFEKHARVNRF
jgi:hypothetical protein